jgi:hypothetical protein
MTFKSLLQDIRILSSVEIRIEYCWIFCKVSSYEPIEFVHYVAFTFWPNPSRLKNTKITSLSLQFKSVNPDYLNIFFSQASFSIIITIIYFFKLIVGSLQI